MPSMMSKFTPYVVVLGANKYIKIEGASAWNM